MTRCCWKACWGDGMIAGDVLYFSDFAFADGGHADKLLVVLSDGEKPSVVLIIATSKGKDANAHGCQPVQKNFSSKGESMGSPRIPGWICRGGRSCLKQGNFKARLTAEKFKKCTRFRSRLSMRFGIASSVMPSNL